MLPCVGRSSRFPNMRPKWSLAHPSGRLMVAQSILGLDLSLFDSVVMTVVKMDIEKYNLRNGLFKVFGEFEIEFILHELDYPTKSQSETVSRTINDLNLTENIFVKDCDGYFEVDEICTVYLCYLLAEHNFLYFL